MRGRMPDSPPRKPIPRRNRRSSFRNQGTHSESESERDSGAVGGRFGVDREEAELPIIVVADDLAQRAAGHWLTEGLAARIHAALPRNISATEMIAAIEAVAAGLYVFHPANAELLPGARSEETDAAPEGAVPLAEPLTPREIEVLQLLAGGLGNKEIAAQLNISEHTAKFHVASIMGKLGAASRTEAVTRGIRHGLVMI